MYQLNYGIEYLGVGMVMWYQKSTHADSKSWRVYLQYTWYVVENKEVPDRNIDVHVPPVRKYADYRTL